MVDEETKQSIERFWETHEQLEFNVGSQKAKQLYGLLTNGLKVVEVGLSKNGTVNVIVQKRC